MTESQSTGKCILCGRDLTRRGASAHIKSCVRKNGVPADAKEPPSRCFHLVVEGAYSPHFWLHIGVEHGVELFDIDQFLRAIWVECCHHLSAFTIGPDQFMYHEGQTYGLGGEDDEEEDLRSPLRDLLFSAMASMPMGREYNMSVDVSQILRPGLKFEYEYDFGTTTRLALRVVTECELSCPDSGIRLLARNDPLDLRCYECQSPATQLCTDCQSNEGLVCDKHAEEHPCGEDMLLPIVNSPRLGMCGYSGPSRTDGYVL